MVWRFCRYFRDSPSMRSFYCKFIASFLYLLGFSRFCNLISLCFSGVFLSCFVTLARALYGPQTDVVQLTANNFRSMVMDSDSVWLVEFFAPWYVFPSCLALFYVQSNIQWGTLLTRTYKRSRNRSMQFFRK